MLSVKNPADFLITKNFSCFLNIDGILIFHSALVRNYQTYVLMPRGLCLDPSDLRWLPRPLILFLNIPFGHWKRCSYVVRTASCIQCQNVKAVPGDGINKVIVTQGGVGLAEGTVKWFSDKKGYGFIEQEDGTDVFVHHTSIDMPGFRTLAEGERVSFEIETSTRGSSAKNVLKL